jgi:hypothetical protein
MKKPLISLEELFCWPLSKASNILTTKKKRQDLLLKKQGEVGDRNLQREGAEEAPLYCKQKTH